MSNPLPRAEPWRRTRDGLLPPASEWWLALRWVWATFTLLVATSLAGSAFPYRQVVEHGHPWLPRRECSGCPLCGMTRSYCAMTSGRWEAARRWNPAGPVAWGGSWVWLGISAAVLPTRRRLWKRASEPARGAAAESGRG